MTSKRPTNNLKYTYNLVAALRTVILLCLYVANRSVFLDEANLIRNIVESGYRGLAGPLDYEQSAPFLFSWLVKSTAVLGYHSLIFRATPLLFAISSIWLMRALFLRLGLGYAGAAMLMYMGCHELVLQYSSECKQYSADLFATALLLYMTVQYTPNNTKKSIALWATVGVLLQLLSMPSIIILAAVGCYWVLTYYQVRQLWPGVLLIGFAWLAAFGFNYFLVLRPGISSEHMQAFHEPYFFDPTDAKALTQLLSATKLIAKKTALGIGTSLLLTLIGIWHIYKKQQRLLLLLLLPVVLTYSLSALGLYSLIERLLLFLLPVVLTLVAYGLHYVIHHKHKAVAFLATSLLAIGLLIAISHRQGFKWFSTHPYEDLRTTLVELPADIREPIYISKHAVATYHYYTQIEKVLTPHTYIAGKTDENIVAEISTHLDIHGDNWVILSHVNNMETVKQSLKQQYTIVKKLESQGSCAFLLEK